MASRLRFLVAGSFAIMLLAGVAPGARGDTEDDLALQKERQKQIQADTDSMVRRLGTMLRVLEYYQVDKSGERKMLEEMAGVLSGLSKNQMAEVVRRLEGAAALAGKDEAKSTAEVQKAYERHREILDTLRTLLARHDAIGSLEQAAERLESLARGELELHFQTDQLIRDTKDQSNLLPAQRFQLIRRRNLSLEPQRQSDAQTEIQQDLLAVIRQVLTLVPKLQGDQKQRALLMPQRAAQQRVLDDLGAAAAKLKAFGYGAQRYDAWLEASGLEWQAAEKMRELARILRGSADALAALREARDRVDLALSKEEEISKETKATLENPEPKSPKADPERVLELARDQARVQYESKDTGNLVKPYAEDVADKIARAVEAMNDSRNALQKIEARNATEPQAKAAKTLEEARADLDKLIAAAEKAKNDPLAALKKAADDLDKLIKDQTQTRDQTQDAAKEDAKTSELAKKQRELAYRAQDLKETPLPTGQKAKDALADANKAMNQAAKELKNQNAQDAVPKQDQALKALDEARKQLAEKMAELQKRQDDMAKLEDAAKKLAELTQAEKNIANQAKDMAAKPDTGAAQDLAKNQDKLTPQAKDLAKNIQPSAPDAADKVNEGTKNMEAAKNQLDQNQPKPASSHAKEAAKKLEDAQKALAKALQDLKAKDIADRAALQPQKLDPQAAAQLLENALNETERAENQARQAEALAKQQQRAADLIRMQEDIAKQADNLNLPDSAKPAAKAAGALKQADLARAIDNQENALENLNDAAEKPRPSQKSPAERKSDLKLGEAKSAPKGGDPAAAKMNQFEPGAEKPGDPKAVGSRNTKKAGPPDKNAAEAKSNASDAAQAKPAPTPGDMRAARLATGKAGANMAAQAKASAAKNKPPEANLLQAKAGGPPQDNDAKSTEPKAATALAGSAKAGEPMRGEAKPALAQAGAVKSGPAGEGLAKAGDSEPGNDGQPEEAQAKAAESFPLPQAKNPAELAQLQKEVLDATKALKESQNATQAAMAALGQAQAQAPQTIQKQLRNAGQQLAKANQNLQNGKPAQAGQKQSQAAKELAKALGNMNAALKGMNKQPGQAQAKAGQPGQEGQDGQDGMGEEGMGKQGQGQKGQAKAPGQKQGKQGPAQERNENLGKGDRTPDGKVANAPSRLTDADGDGSFLHLPPRQRELIRQALSGQLPPEYAAMIQQYFVNIARGRAMPGAAPALPGSNK
jgi:hypothetical protein